MYRKLCAALALLILLGAMPLCAQASAYYKPGVTLNDVTEVTADGAQLNGVAYSGSAVRFTGIGLYFNADAAKIGTNRYTRGINRTTTSFNIKFTAEDIHDYYGRLRPGTMYYYKLFVVADGKEYVSPLGSFRTADDKQSGSKVDFTVYDAAEVGMDSAIVRARVSKNPHGLTFTKVGLMLGQSADALQEIASAKANRADLPDIQFAVGQYKRLQPQSTYYYQFYAMTNSGTSYASQVRSFTTAPPSFPVYLHPNGGTLVHSGAMMLTPGQYYMFEVLPSREGHVFQGWYTDPTGGVPVANAGMWPYTGEMILYAHWGAAADSKALQVFFDVNYQDRGVSETKDVKKGGKYGTLPTPERSGYKFGGWYTEPDGGTRVKSSTKVNLTGTQVLYARWTPRSYKITFNASGGKVKPTEATMQYGTTYKLPVPEREGYTFAGWYTAKEGGTLIAQEWTLDVTGKTTLYARWTPLAYGGLPGGVTPVG